MVHRSPLANRQGIQSGDVRVGFHVQAFGDGGSEAFVNQIPAVGGVEKEVPEPTTMAAAGLALAGGRLLKRRTAKKNKKA